MLSRSAQRVQVFLNQQGINSTVIELPSTARTAQEAAQSIGCDVAQIVKSLLFRAEDGVPVLALVSGKNRVSLETLSCLVGKKLSKADADFTRLTTSFAIGGVAPVGHPQPIQTFIDEELLLYQEIWAAAGTPFAVFKLESARLAELTHSKIVSLKAT